MAGYIGSKAVTLSTTAADVTGDATINGNLTVNGTTITVDSAAAQEIRLGDNDKMTFGDATGGDLQIYHDGSASYVRDTGTGGLRLQAASDIRFVGNNTGENMLIATENSSVDLYYDNAKKLATTSTGVDITGTLTSDGLTVQGDTYLNTAESPVVTNVDTWAAQTTNALRIGVSSNADYNSVAGYGGIQFTESGWGSTVASIGVGSWSGDGTEQGYAQDIVFHMKQSGASNDFDKVMRITRGGDISFYEDTGTTPKFFWDASAESLGIGTSSPSTLMHISGSSSSVDGIHYIVENTRSAGGPAGIVMKSNHGDWKMINSQTVADALEFIDGSAGATRMLIDSSGRVGIGTSSPTRKLEVVDNGDILQLTGIAGNAFVRFTDNDASSDFSIGADDGSGAGAGAFMVYDRNNSAYRMIINSSGNVGIGTVSPTEKLEVSGGNIQVDSFSRKIGFKVSGNSNAGYLIPYDGSGNTQLVNERSSGNLIFKSANTERMRILSNGVIMVGLTSQMNGGDRGIELDGPNGTILTGKSSAQTRTHLSFVNPNGVVGSITTNNAATAYNTSSDYRLKENVTDVTDGITRVKQLAPKRFNFIAHPDVTVDGFLAHEAQAVVPEAVTGTQDAIDAEGNPDYQGIDQSKLVPLLTAALQEAIAKIETLETEMTSVKARLDVLEGN